MELKLETWRLLDLEYEDSFMNMAVEEAVPRAVGQGIISCTLRLWRNPNTAVIGNNQSANLEVDLDACEKYGTKIVRRFTGGGAVYHDYGNLNYAISIPKKHKLVPQTNPMEVFRRFSEGTILSLKSLGLQANLISNNNVEINQKKVCGAAGAIKWNSVLYHSSILVCSNTKILSHVLKPDKYATTKYVKSSRRPVTTISKELDTHLTTSEFSDTLVKCFERLYGIRFLEGPLTKKEMNLADELYEKYSNYNWNFKM